MYLGSELKDWGMFLVVKEIEDTSCKVGRRGVPGWTLAYNRWDSYVSGSAIHARE